MNLEKIGKVKCSSSYDIDFTKEDSFKNPHVSFNGRCWVLTFGLELKNEIQQLTNEVLGIDLGIKYLAVCSDGVIYKNINKEITIKKLEKRLKRLQRRVSRKHKLNKKGGNRYIKTNNIKKLEKDIKHIHQRLKNIRLNYLHQTTTSIVKTKPCKVVMEDLNITNMMKNKCEWNGIEFIQVDRYYPSSKMCSKCGNIKHDLKLSDRRYTCECGLNIDRDFNASLNLMNYGLSH